MSSDAHVENCVFVRNSANRGGAIAVLQSSPTVESCVFFRNETTSSSSWGGGAILFDYLCYGTVTNCLFVANESASSGGAMSFHMGYPTITNCTIADNLAADSGGAIMSDTSAPSLKNCILWDNAPDEISSFGANSPSVIYSDVEGGYTGTGNIDLDPLFVGPTDYRLALSSPCVDTANNGAAPDEDLNGAVRPQDGDGDGSAVSDMGAYELSELLAPLHVGDSDCSGNVDLADATCLLGYLSGDAGHACASPCCLASLDVDGSGSIDHLDALAIIHYQFGTPMTAPDGTPINPGDDGCHAYPRPYVPFPCDVTCAP